MKHVFTITVLLLLLPAEWLGAQACCSAGVPLLGALEFPATAGGRRS